MALVTRHVCMCVVVLHKLDRGQGWGLGLYHMLLSKHVWLPWYLDEGCGMLSCLCVATCLCVCVLDCVGLS